MIPNIDEKDEILVFGPHAINNLAIITKTWTPKFSFNEEMIQTIPLRLSSRTYLLTVGV